MSSPSSPGKKGKQPQGVRGPGGPPPPPARTPAASSGPSKGQPVMPTKPASPTRVKFENFSYPIVERLNRLPKFVIIVTPGVLLFLGLVLTGALAWIGGVLMLVVAAMLAWLTALSWPVIPVRSRVIRVIVVAVVIGFAGLKFTGRF